MQATVARVRDHEVEMESDAERRRLTRVRVQWHHRAEDHSQRIRGEAYRRHNLIRVYIGQPFVIAVSGSVAAVIPWLIYECSDTVEQRMIQQWQESVRRHTLLLHCNTSLPARLSCMHSLCSSNVLFSLLHSDSTTYLVQQTNNLLSATNKQLT